MYFVLEVQSILIPCQAGFTCITIVIYAGMTMSWERQCEVGYLQVTLIIWQDRNLEVNRFLSERSLLSKCTGPSYQSWRTDSMWKHATLFSGPIYRDIASFDWILFCWRRRLQFQSVQDPCHYPAGNQVVEKGRFNQVSTPLGERTTPKIISQADDD